MVIESYVVMSETKLSPVIEFRHRREKILEMTQETIMDLRAVSGINIENYVIEILKHTLNSDFVLYDNSKNMIMKDRNNVNKLY